MSKSFSFAIFKTSALFVKLVNLNTKQPRFLLRMIKRGFFFGIFSEYDTYLRINSVFITSFHKLNKFKQYSKLLKQTAYPSISALYWIKYCTYDPTVPLFLSCLCFFYTPFYHDYEFRENTLKGFICGVVSTFKH